jgi:hypothetical protein
MAKPIELAALEQLMWRVLTEREQSEDEREHSAVSFIQKPHGLEFADWPEVAGMFYRLVAKFARRVTIVKEHTDWKFDFLFEHRGSLFGGMFWRPVEFGALAYEEIMAFRDRLDEDGLDYGMMAGFYACDEEKKNFGRMLGIEIVSQEATGRLLNAAAGDPAGSRHRFLVQELRIPVGVLAESKKVLSFLNDAWAKIREEEGKCVYPERTRLVNNQKVNLPGFLESVGSTYLRIAEKGQLIGTYISKVDVWKALMKLWQGKSLTRKTLPVPTYEADDLFGLLSHLPHTTGTRNQIRLLSSARK